MVGSSFISMALVWLVSKNSPLSITNSWKKFCAVHGNLCEEGGEEYMMRNPDSGNSPKHLPSLHLWYRIHDFLEEFYSLLFALMVIATPCSIRIPILSNISSSATQVSNITIWRNVTSRNMTNIEMDHWHLGRADGDGSVTFKNWQNFIDLLRSNVSENWRQGKVLVSEISRKDRKISKRRFPAWQIRFSFFSQRLPY